MAYTNNDFGVSAAMKLALRTFEFTSRCTGRTTLLVETARDGDIIITSSQQHKRLVEYALLQADSAAISTTGRRRGMSIRVFVVDPKRDIRNLTNVIRPQDIKGRILYDHEFIRDYWMARFDEIGSDLFEMATRMGNDTPPPMPHKRQEAMDAIGSM